MLTLQLDSSWTLRNLHSPYLNHVLEIGSWQLGIAVVPIPFTGLRMKGQCVRLRASAMYAALPRIFTSQGSRNFDMYTRLLVSWPLPSTHR